MHAVAQRVADARTHPSYLRFGGECGAAAGVRGRRDELHCTASLCSCLRDDRWELAARWIDQSVERPGARDHPGDIWLEVCLSASMRRKKVLFGCVGRKVCANDTAAHIHA